MPQKSPPVHHTESSTAPASNAPTVQRMDVLTLSARQGYSDDWMGQLINGGLFKVGFNQDNENNGLSGDVGVGTFGAEASISDSTASVGLQANAIEGSMTYSNIASADIGRSVRGGLSRGLGAAGRVHYGDADNDGWREYGFGFDAGPVSFDYKTEDIVGDILRFSPWTMPYMSGVSLDTNITRGMYNAGAAAWDYGGQAVDAIGEGLAYVGGGIANVASSAADAIGSGLYNIGTGMTSGLHDMMNGDWSLW